MTTIQWANLHRACLKGRQMSDPHLSSTRPSHPAARTVRIQGTEKPRDKASRGNNSTNQSNSRMFTKMSGIKSWVKKRKLGKTSGSTPKKRSSGKRLTIKNTRMQCLRKLREPSSTKTWQRRLRGQSSSQGPSASSQSTETSIWTLSSRFQTNTTACTPTPKTCQWGKWSGQTSWATASSLILRPRSWVNTSSKLTPSPLLSQLTSRRDFWKIKALHK